MDAVILAAGQGTRLRPLTDTTPKPLIPVAGRGTLLRLLDELPDVVDRIILVIGYLGHKIREEVGDVYAGRPVTYITQETLDGTGGALACARPFLQSEYFLVCAADDLCVREDLEQLCAVPRAILVQTTSLPKPMDVWKQQDGRWMLTRAEAGERATMNACAATLGHEWFDAPRQAVPMNPHEWSMPHTLAQIMNKYGYRVQEATFWKMCGTLEEIAEAERALEKRAIL